jgi:hypothetical protein
VHLVMHPSVVGMAAASQVAIRQKVGEVRGC